MRRSPLIGLLLALTLLVGACSGSSKDPTASELRAKIATQVRGIQTSLTAKQADCYAGLLVKEIGTKTINDLDLRDKAPDPKVAKDLAAAAVAATTSCGIAGGATTTSSSPPTSTTSTTSAG
jgi:hypothetical protein